MGGCGCASEAFGGSGCVWREGGGCTVASCAAAVAEASAAGATAGCSLFRRAAAIKLLKSSLFFFAHAAPSKSLRITAAGCGWPPFAEKEPWLLSHASRSLSSSFLVRGRAESQFAFHRLIHSVWRRMSRARGPEEEILSSESFLRRALSLRRE